MFIIQIIFCIQANTVQFSNSGERKNILFFYVHKWLVCQWDLFLRFLMFDFLRHDCCHQPLKSLFNIG
jgi:hypothetical protein